MTDSPRIEEGERLLSSTAVKCFGGGPRRLRNWVEGIRFGSSLCRRVAERFDFLASIDISPLLDPFHDTVLAIGAMRPMAERVNGASAVTGKSEGPFAGPERRASNSPWKGGKQEAETEPERALMDTSKRWRLAAETQPVGLQSLLTAREIQAQPLALMAVLRRYGNAESLNHQPGQEIALFRRLGHDTVEAAGEGEARRRAASIPGKEGSFSKGRPGFLDAPEKKQRKWIEEGDNSQDGESLTVPGRHRKRVVQQQEAEASAGEGTFNHGMDVIRRVTSGEGSRAQTGPVSQAEDKGRIVQRVIETVGKETSRFSEMINRIDPVDDGAHVKAHEKAFVRGNPRQSSGIQGRAWDSRAEEIDKNRLSETVVAALANTSEERATGRELQTGTLLQTLERIEGQLVRLETTLPVAIPPLREKRDEDPTVGWLEDEDLAGRLQKILRRQAKRRGIDLT